MRTIMNITKTNLLRNVLNFARKSKNNKNTSFYNKESCEKFESYKSKRIIVGYFSPEIHKNVKLLAV